MTEQKILFIFRHSPYASITPQETLEMVLISASFEKKVELLFIEDGVLLLKQQQMPEKIAMKPFTAAFAALGDFDIEKVYIEQQALKSHAIKQEQLMMIHDDQQRDIREPISSIQIPQLLSQYDVVLTD